MPFLCDTIFSVIFLSFIIFFLYFSCLLRDAVCSVIFFCLLKIVFSIFHAFCVLLSFSVFFISYVFSRSYVPFLVILPYFCILHVPIYPLISSLTLSYLFIVYVPICDHFSVPFSLALSLRSQRLSLSLFSSTNVRFLRRVLCLLKGSCSQSGIREVIGAQEAIGLHLVCLLPLCLSVCLYVMYFLYV